MFPDEAVEGEATGTGRRGWHSEKELGGGTIRRMFFRILRNEFDFVYKMRGEISGYHQGYL